MSSTVLEVSKAKLKPTLASFSRVLPTSVTGRGEFEPLASRWKDYESISHHSSRHLTLEAQTLVGRRAVPDLLSGSKLPTVSTPRA